jgi:hypothetical protein
MLVAGCAMLEGRRLRNLAPLKRWEQAGLCSSRCGNQCAKDPYRIMCSMRVHPGSVHEHWNNMDGLLISYKGKIDTEKEIFTVPKRLAQRNRWKSMDGVMRWNKQNSQRWADHLGEFVESAAAEKGSSGTSGSASSSQSDSGKTSAAAGEDSAIETAKGGANETDKKSAKKAKKTKKPDLSTDPNAPQAPHEYHMSNPCDVHPVFKMSTEEWLLDTSNQGWKPQQNRFEFPTIKPPEFVGLEPGETETL